MLWSFSRPATRREVVIGLSGLVVVGCARNEIPIRDEPFSFEPTTMLDFGDIDLATNPGVASKTLTGPDLREGVPFFTRVKLSSLTRSTSKYNRITIEFRRDGALSNSAPILTVREYVLRGRAPPRSIKWMVPALSVPGDYQAVMLVNDHDGPKRNGPSVKVAQLRFHVTPAKTPSPG